MGATSAIWRVSVSKSKAGWTSSSRQSIRVLIGVSGEVYMCAFQANNTSEHGPQPRNFEWAFSCAPQLPLHQQRAVVTSVLSQTQSYLQPLCLCSRPLLNTPPTSPIVATHTMADLLESMDDEFWEHLNIKSACCRAGSLPARRCCAACC